MSSRSEDRQGEAGGEQIKRAVADAREAAREITHSRTDRARVLSEGERLLSDDAHVEQQAAQQSARFVAVGVAGDTVGPELAEYVDTGAGITEETRDVAAPVKARDHAKDCRPEGDSATGKGEHREGAVTSSEQVRV